MSTFAFISLSQGDNPGFPQTRPSDIVIGWVAVRYRQEYFGIEGAGRRRTVTRPIRSGDLGAEFYDQTYPVFQGSGFAKVPFPRRFLGCQRISRDPRPPVPTYTGPSPVTHPY